jgi:glucose-1-phosphate thymidylyltransferase
VKAVILAAGYATRLYPLTLDRPKHLLELGGKPVLDHLLERLPLSELDAIYVVTNGKFASRFRDWSRGRSESIEVIDDGTTSEDDRLGAIGDLQLVISSRGLDDDLCVAAGDSLFSERLDGLVSFARARQASATAVYDVVSLEAVKRMSAVGLDEDDRVVAFQEKPERPESTLAGIALYVYTRETLPFVAQYLEEGNNPDQPGRLLEWLYPRVPVYGWRVPGLWFDIGTPDSLAEAATAVASLGGAGGS